MNFCSNCGAKVQENAKFCIKCGTKLLGITASPNNMEETAATAEISSVNEQKAPVYSPLMKKNRKNLFVFIAVFVLLFAVGSFSYGFFFNKSPKQLYFTAELNSYKDMLQSFQDLYGDDWELNKHMTENPYRNKMTITGQIDGTNIPEIAEINHYLTDSSIELITSQDPKLAKGMLSLSLLLNGSNVFQTEVFQSDDQTGLSIPFLYSQYFYMNNDDLGRLMREIDAYYVGPERLENFTEYMTSSIETEFLKHGTRYVEYITTSLTDENFSLEEGVTFRGEKFRKVTLSLSERQIKTLLEGLISKLQKDTELQDLIINQLEASITSSYDYQFSREEMRQELDYAFSELLYGLEYVSFPEGFKSELMIDKSNKIVSRNVAMKIAPTDYPSDSISLNYVSTIWKNGKQIEKTKELTVAPNDIRDGSFDFYWNSTNDANRITTNAGMKLTENREAAFDIRLNMDTKQSKDTTETNFDLVLSGYEFYDVPTISGTMKRKTDQNLSRNYANRDMEITLIIGMDDYYYGYQELLVKLGVESKTEFTDKLHFPQLSQNTATNILDLSEYEIISIFEEIGYNLENIFYGATWY